MNWRVERRRKRQHYALGNSLHIDGAAAAMDKGVSFNRFEYGIKLLDLFF